MFLTACANGKNNDDLSQQGLVSGYITVLSREDGSGTRDSFVELIDAVDDNGYDAITDTAEITNSTSVMLSTVISNKRAIGYVSLGSMSDVVKAVAIDGVKPSAQAIRSGDYVLQRAFYIAYVNDLLSNVSQDFIKFIMSKQGGEIISDEGYVSVESNYDYTSSNLSGTVTLAGSTSVAPVMNVIADRYKELNPNIKVEIQESGSSAGIESAIQGAVDIAMSSRDLKDEELDKLDSKTIARDGIVVIVNSKNNIDNLTTQQVKSIFIGESTKWDEL
jgi:phosphate transport system substrate-binding protein